MKFEERINNLILQAKGLPYRDKGQLDEFRAGVRDLIIEIFGDKSEYLNDLNLIRFVPTSFYSSAAEYAASWNVGISSVIHLLNRILVNPVIGGTPQVEAETQNEHKQDGSYERMGQAMDSLLDTKAINEFANKSTINENNIVITESSAPTNREDEHKKVETEPKVSKIGEFKNSLLSVFKVAKTKTTDKPSTDSETPSDIQSPSTPSDEEIPPVKEEPVETPDESTPEPQEQPPTPPEAEQDNTVQVEPPEKELDLREVDPHEEIKVDEVLQPTDDIANYRPGQQHTANKVFVLHDTEETIKNSVVDKLSRCGLFPVVLKNRQNISKSLTQKMTEFKDVKFAVVILSDSEMAHPKTLHSNEANMQSSQNLIFELGFWVGHLGRERVFVLYPDSRKFVRPTEYFDVFYQLYDKHGNWFMELIQKLKKCGFKLSL